MKSESIENFDNLDQPKNILKKRIENEKPIKKEIL